MCVNLPDKLPIFSFSRRYSNIYPPSFFVCRSCGAKLKNFRGLFKMLHTTLQSCWTFLFARFNLWEIFDNFSFIYLFVPSIHYPMFFSFFFRVCHIYCTFHTVRKIYRTWANESFLGGLNNEIMRKIKVIHFTWKFA